MSIQKIIKSRRTTKPLFYTGEKIAENDIKEMLECANWAPTHKYTEPWRFIVYNGNAKNQFGIDHAEMYKTLVPKEKFVERVYNKLSVIAKKSSHIIAVVMKRDSEERIGEIEEVCAVAAAFQNMMLVATEKGIANIWSTSGMTHHPKMKEYLGFGEKDKVIGFLYLGVSDKKIIAKRVSGIEEKVVWKK